MRRSAAILATLSALAAAPARAEGPVLDLPNFPDYVILGTGAGPGYVGADGNVWAVVPAARRSFGRRYVSLEANYLSVNLAGHPHLQAGPAGILRFGRSDAEDDRGDPLPDIGMSVDLGGFLAWETGGPDPRDRWRTGIGLLQDAAGVHDGHVIDVNLRRWLPVGRHAALGLGLAASWASQNYMDAYFSDPAQDHAAGGGWRDARLTAIYVQPVSERWAVGAGFMYSRLLGEAADSPAVLSRDQVYAGIGAARAW
ncbi:MipA/OmpV family protein [Mangrovicoccus sp. HB161399]|uniref:MipA/OmpV family protein n=1 Tax=Mangrovicoccus sp. HB161399 TaxID=2720392 RepID=UPI00155404D1|nr:MipA/OmpV family protein [Mangrovicoccus sp. HB161399]